MRTRTFSLFLVAGLFVPGGMGHPLRAGAQKPAIFIMNADGSEAHKFANLKDFRWLGWPQWSADGKYLAFDAHPNSSMTNTASHIITMPLDGGELKDLGFGKMPSWSPDGKQIVFTQLEDNAAGEKPGVWLMKADGTGRKRLSDGREASFCPDGTRISFVDDSLFVYELASGNVTELLGGTQPEKLFGAAWSADGKRLCFVRRREDGIYELVIVDVAQKTTKVRFSGRSLGKYVNWAPGEKILLGMKFEDEQLPVQVMCALDPDKNDSPVRLKNQDAGRLNVNPSWSPGSKQIAFTSDRN